MAAEWIPCGSGFIEADVIRWNEGVWQKPRGRRGRTVNIGERQVVAEVIRDAGGWVDLLVRDSTIASEKPGRKVFPLAKNLEVRRKRRTIQKGKPERLLWSDESVRALLVSKLPGADNPSASGQTSSRAHQSRLGDGRSAQDTEDFAIPRRVETGMRGT